MLQNTTHYVKKKKRDSEAVHSTMVTWVQTLGGSRFGFCTKKTVKYDEKEPLIREHFEYVEFMWKEWFWDFDIFVQFTLYVEFVHRDVSDEFDVTIQ